MKTFRALISFLLVLAMMASLIPGVFATGGEMEIAEASSSAEIDSLSYEGTNLSKENFRLPFDDYKNDVILDHEHIPEEIPMVPPTCVEYGVTRYKGCTACDYVWSYAMNIEPTGHTLVDGCCINCDYRQPEGGYVPADPYVFHHDVDGNGYEGYQHQYFSPYYTQYNYNDGERQGVNTIFIYSMYNTVTEEVVPTYCTDIFTGAYSGTTYQRINLMDSTNRTAAWNEDLLRAIMLGGFYLPTVQEETEEEHNARVEAKLQTLREATGISDLTIGEAIAATQLAIWRTAHGEKLVFEPMVRNVYGPSSTQVGLFKYYDLCDQERQNGHYTTSYGSISAESKAYITQRIETLYNYLLALSPVEQEASVIANGWGIDCYVRGNAIRNTDGTYDIYLTARVYEPYVSAEDRLTITAYINGDHYVQAEVVPGVEEYNLVLKNVPLDLFYKEEDAIKTDITVSLDGVQTFSDIVLYEANGGADMAQSMLGMDTSCVPVHSETAVKAIITGGAQTELSHSVSLGSNIAINYILPISEISYLTEYYFYCFVGDEVVFLEPEIRGDYVYFTYDGFTAVNMNDEINAKFYRKAGKKENEDNMGRYSIATYAYSMLNKAETKAGLETVKTLCADLLRYGATAQIFKGYKVDNLADSRMTEAHRAYLTDLDAVEFGQPYRILSDLAEPAVKWMGRSLSLDSTIVINLIVDASDYAGDPLALELRASYTDVRGEEKTATLNPGVYNEEMNWYVFTVDGLNAADLRSVLTCQVFENEEPVSQTMIYSADSYGNNKPGTLGDLCKALFAYVDSAREFFAG